MAEQTNVINIDGKEYKQDDFSEAQKVIINRLSKLQVDAQHIRVALNENVFLQESYVKKLKESLENKTNTDLL